MKKTFSVLGIISALLIQISVLHAETNQDVEIPKLKSRVYNFQEIDILGNTKSPAGNDKITACRDFKFERLLNPEETFIPNLTRSVFDF